MTETICQTYNYLFNVNPSSAKALSKPNKWWCRLFGNTFRPDTKRRAVEGDATPKPQADSSSDTLAGTESYL